MHDFPLLQSKRRLCKLQGLLCGDTATRGGGGGRLEGWKGAGGQTGIDTKSIGKYGRIEVTFSMLCTLPRRGRTHKGHHSERKKEGEGRMKGGRGEVEEGVGTV